MRHEIKIVPSKVFIVCGTRGQIQISVEGRIKEIFLAYIFARKMILKLYSKNALSIKLVGFLSFSPYTLRTVVKKKKNLEINLSKVNESAGEVSTAQQTKCF